MPLTLVVLGANSAQPIPGRFSSSFVLIHNDHRFLIDAGEGCQIKMGQFKVKRSRISDVFISHLHGDHLYGLPGFITSLNLNQRKDPLHVWGPIGIKKYLNTIQEVSSIHMNFDLVITEIDNLKPKKITGYDGLEVVAFPMKHRIPTYGYLFREVRKDLNIRPEQVDHLNLTIEEIRKIKAGGDITRSGQVIKNEVLTYQKGVPRSFAYCSDTIYDESLVNIIRGVDVLYHEATYTEEFRDKAAERMHSTSREAALIAKKAKVNRLLIGHYSSRYGDLSPLLSEAQEVFEKTMLATEGVVINI